MRSLHCRRKRVWRCRSRHIVVGEMKRDWPKKRQCTVCGRCDFPLNARQSSRILLLKSCQARMNRAAVFARHACVACMARTAVRAAMVMTAVIHFLVRQFLFGSVYCFSTGPGKWLRFSEYLCCLECFGASRLLLNRWVRAVQRRLYYCYSMFFCSSVNI